MSEAAAKKSALFVHLLVYDFMHLCDLFVHFWFVYVFCLCVHRFVCLCVSGLFVQFILSFLSSRHAKKENVRLWKGFTPSATSTGDLSSKAKNFTAKVMEIGNGDNIVVKKGDGSTQKIFFSSFRAPRLCAKLIIKACIFHYFIFFLQTSAAGRRFCSSCHQPAGYQGPPTLRHTLHV